MAFATEDYERAEFLFDSLVTHVARGTYMDNFRVRKASGRKIDFYDFDKPVFLMTYAAWCTPGIGEIPALNKIADTYYDKVQVVVLFWDNKKKVKEVAADYSNDITLLYVDEAENKHDHIIETLKHSLGFPTTFFIDSDKKIMDIRRGVLHPYGESYETSFNLNYSAFLSGISTFHGIDMTEEELAAKKTPRP
ncbi:MAG: thiol-disulfide oxidoreductase [Flavobacteriaceae bacterium]|nr:thiol-disulfide oxidoreductase [Flavobacteriaceae bacterium]